MRLTGLPTNSKLQFDLGEGGAHLHVRLGVGHGNLLDMRA